MLALVPPTGANADYIVADAVKDANGNMKTMTDPIGTETLYEHDSRNRQIRKTVANGTSVAAITETTYDLASNVIKVRSPRDFDTSDPEDGNMYYEYEYNGRNMRTKTKVGTSATVISETTYTLEGKVATTKDADGNTWASDYDTSCCGSFSGRYDPLGHGNMTNSNYVGLATHSGVVKDYTSHADKHDFDDTLTLNETTTSYDGLRRVTARTQWLVAQGTVNHQLPSHAGLFSVAAADGITTQTFYDSNLADGVGMDSSGGMTISKLGGGTYGLSLNAVLTQLADTIATAGLTSPLLPTKVPVVL